MPQPVHTAYIELRADHEKFLKDVVAAVKRAEKEVATISIGANNLLRPRGLEGVVRERDVSKLKNLFNEPTSGGGAAFLSGAGFFKGLSGLATLYGVGRYFKYAVDQAIEFEYGMARINTLLTKSEQKFLPELEKGIKRLGLTYGESFGNIQKGAYELISAQIPVEKVIDVLDVASKAAKAGFTDTATTVEVLSSVLNSYEMDASKAKNISDVLFRTIDRGTITYEQLAKTIGKVASQGSLAGVAFEDLMATIATLTRAGIRPAEAMTAVGGFIDAFLNPTPEAIATAEKYGIELNSDTLRRWGISGVAEMLKEAPPEDIRKITNLRKGFRVAAVLRNKREENFQDIVEMRAAARGETSATDEAAEKVLNTTRVELDRIKTRMSAIFATSNSVLKIGTISLLKAATNVVADDEYLRQKATFGESVGDAYKTRILQGLISHFYPSTRSDFLVELPNLNALRVGKRIREQQELSRKLNEEQINNAIGRIDEELKTLSPKLSSDRPRINALLARRKELRQYLKEGTLFYDTEPFLKKSSEDTRRVDEEKERKKAVYKHALMKVYQGYKKGQARFFSSVEDSLAFGEIENKIYATGVGDTNFNKQINLLDRQKDIAKNTLRLQLARKVMTEGVGASKDLYKEVSLKMRLLDAQTEVSKQEVRDAEEKYKLQIKTRSEDILSRSKSLEVQQKIFDLEQSGREEEATKLKIKDSFRIKKEELQKQIEEVKRTGTPEDIKVLENDLKRLNALEESLIKSIGKDSLYDRLSLNRYLMDTFTPEGLMRDVIPGKTSIASSPEAEYLQQLKALNEKFEKGVTITNSNGVLQIRA